MSKEYEGCMKFTYGSEGKSFFPLLSGTNFNRPSSYITKPPNNKRPQSMFQIIFGNSS